MAKVLLCCVALHCTHWKRNCLGREISPNIWLNWGCSIFLKIAVPIKYQNYVLILCFGYNRRSMCWWDPFCPRRWDPTMSSILLNASLNSDFTLSVPRQVQHHWFRSPEQKVRLTEWLSLISVLRWHRWLSISSSCRVRARKIDRDYTD